MASGFAPKRSVNSRKIGAFVVGLQQTALGLPAYGKRLLANQRIVLL